MINAHRTGKRRSVDLDVESKLNQLSSLPIARLRISYRELFRSEPPSAFGPDLLRRSIAQQIQVKAHGDLSRETKKLLSQMVRSMATGKAGCIKTPQRIKAGSELVRTWNDQLHKVTVLAKGFAYQGEVFPSLSEIANKITGTRWNGPKFFGLRTRAKEIGTKTISKGALRGSK